MNIKKKLITFILTFIVVLCLIPTIRGQATTTDVGNSSNSDQSSNAATNSGTPENKPAALNVSNAIAVNNPQSITKIEDSKLNITSTIGWKNENGAWYYYKLDNTKAIGWIKPDSNWYYLKDDGKMATGWLYDGSDWYYLDDSGTMVTGWKQVNNQWYFLTSSGSMARGWINLSGTWYYLNNDGSMATGWVTSNGSNYYLDTATGRMLTDTIIDGYKIGADGKRYGTSTQNSSASASNENPSSKYYGIDISNYDGGIDFNGVKSSGAQLVYIKATEGTTYVDPYLQINYNGASKAGLKVGFYHFLVGTSAPETQADNFYNSIKDKKNDLKPMLDIESTGFDVMDYTLRFIAEFKKISNMNIGIYTYSSFMSNLDGRLSGYPLWEANYNNTPFNNLPINSIWISRVGHQYSETGFVRGISSNVDLDEFTQGIFE